MVKVLDQNDNAPQFQVVDLIVTITEETPIGDEVARLVAVDVDATATNSEVTYQVAVILVSTKLNDSLEQFLWEVYLTVRWILCIFLK